MNFAKEARKLANYIDSLEDFIPYSADGQIKYNHIGALLTDIVLQAGLSYNSVVKPRVHNILLNYNNANTVIKFQDLILEIGLERIMNWQHEIKLNRMYSLLELLSENNINTCMDFKQYLLEIENRSKLQELDGIGPKTVDYLLKLLNFDVVAVDRHIYTFVEMANIDSTEYYSTKKIVEFAADLLGVSRASLDCSIWHYMSDRYFEKSENSNQLELEFV